MIRVLLVVALLAGCGGSGAGAPDRTERPEPTETPSPWPEEFEEWVCAASDTMRLDVSPALSDMIQAIELLDTPAAIDASDRIGDGAAQVLEFLELAPEWEPGTATVLHLRQWMTLLARGSNQISFGLTNNDSASIDAGLADVNAGSTEADYFSAELRLLQAATGFVC